MLVYILRRVISSLATILAISVVVFALVHAVPGDPIRNFTKHPRISEEDLERIRDKYGLNRPLHEQYILWLAQVARGDLGYSLFSKRPVVNEIGDRLGNTLMLMFPAFLVVILMSVAIGSFSALKRDSLISQSLTLVSLAGYSIPSFLLSLLLISIFYSYLDNPFSGKPLLPSGGLSSAVGGWSISGYFRHLILPVIALSVPWIAWYSRFIRVGVIDTMKADFVISARARGLPRYNILSRHILRIVLLPLISLIALDLPMLFGGSLGVEIVFYWPGMGRLFWDAATKRDYPIILGIIMITAILVIACNFVADIAHFLLDPRMNVGDH